MECLEKAYNCNSKRRRQFEVIDPDYVPSNDKEEDLFDKKQKYMYSVFDKILQTNKAKAFIYAHESNYNI